MCTVLVAVIASVSGLNVAQQELAADLGASQSDLLWVINGYTVVLAALLLSIGAIGDRYGRKHVLLAGLLVFIAANAAARSDRPVSGWRFSMWFGVALAAVALIHAIWRAPRTNDSALEDSLHDSIPADAQLEPR